MGAVIVTTHAVQRYQERVANLSPEEAAAAMDTAAVRLAVEIGAPYVRLGTGQRIVIEDGVIVTVLPAFHPCARMRRRNPEEPA